MKRNGSDIKGVIVAATLWPAALTAGEGGGSNYLPGFYGDQALAVAPPDGFSLRNDLLFLSGDASRTVKSGQIQADAGFDAVFNYLTLLYKPMGTLFGTDYALGVTAAVGNFDFGASLAAGPTVREADDSHTGLGDPTFALYFYKTYGNWHFASANFIVAPFGSYDADRLANTGLNYWTFETDLMLTYLNPDTGQDYSVVIGYGYNTENDDTDYKTGDEFHIDFVLNQYFSETFGIGLTGFYFRQLSGDSGDGALLGDFKGEAAGFGPALYWNPKIGDKQVFLSAKWINEFHVVNRFKSDYVFVSAAMTF